MVSVLNLIAYSILKTATENVKFGCQMNHRMDDDHLLEISPLICKSKAQFAIFF